MKKHAIQVPRTAHYATLGEPGPQVRYCWIACHGYGQLASRFIQKFSVLEARDTFIIAPEGLSRFYWSGFSGNVVASWMTREDRLDEIADFCGYLSMLYEKHIPQLAPDVQIILFGFSQGVATQLRWITRVQPAFHHLICWAGTIPEDLDYRPLNDYFGRRKLHYLYGLEDQFIKPEWIAVQKELMAAQQLHFDITTFQGKHVVEPSVLKALNAHIRTDS